MAEHQASCLCGAVRIEVSGDLPAPDACHCRACRKQTGHFLVSTDVPRDRVHITGAEHVRWFHSSSKVRRGFCGTCGAVLFWDPIERDTIAIAMGAFDAPTNTHIAVNVFTRERGDYYDLDEKLPEFNP